MRILVIGGTLFIGRRLVARLLERGDEVTVLHRTPGHDLGSEVAELLADRNDGAATAAALAGRRFDAVVDNVYDWARGTTPEPVMAAARACEGCSRYVFMSSVAAYGSGERRLESDALAPADDPDVYVRNKANTERALFELHAHTGFPVVTLRPAFVYGPGNPFYREQFFWDRLLAGRPVIVPGDGARRMQFTYVDDLVDACLRALDDPGAAGQAFNIADPDAIEQREAVAAIARAAGVEARLRFIARETLIAGGGDAFRPPLYFGAYFDLPTISMDTSKARRMLGWESTPLAEGLHKGFEWYRQSWRTGNLDFEYEDRMLAASSGS